MRFEGIEVISEEAARGRGLRALTYAVSAEREADKLRGFIGDMRRKKTVFALVESGGGIEVWREPPGGVA